MVSQVEELELIESVWVHGAIYRGVEVTGRETIYDNKFYNIRLHLV